MLKKMIFLMAALCLSSNAVAQSCADLTGQWQGMLTDSSQVTGDAGPWKVQVALMSIDNQFIGVIKPEDEENPMLATMVSGQIFGTCQDGKITQLIFIHNTLNKGFCKSELRAAGQFENNNQLTMKLPYDEEKQQYFAVSLDQKQALPADATMAPADFHKLYLNQTKDAPICKNLPILEPQPIS